MKKISILILLVLFIVSLSSCDSSSSNRYRSTSENAVPVRYLEKSLDKSLSNSLGTKIEMNVDSSDTEETETASISIKFDDYDAFLKDGKLSHLNFTFITNTTTAFFDGESIYYGDKSNLEKISGFDDVTLKYLIEAKLDFLVPLLDEELFTVSSMSDTSMVLNLENDDENSESIKIKANYSNSGLEAIEMNTTNSEQQEEKLSMKFTEEKYSELDLSKFKITDAQLMYDIKPQVIVDFLVLLRRSSTSQNIANSKGNITLNIFNGLFDPLDSSVSTIGVDFEIYTDNTNNLTTVNSITNYSDLFKNLKFKFDISVDDKMGYNLYHSLYNNYNHNDIKDFSDSKLSILYVGGDSILLSFTSEDKLYGISEVNVYNLIYYFINIISSNSKINTNNLSYLSTKEVDSDTDRFNNFLSGISSEVSVDNVKFSLDETALTEVNFILSSLYDNSEITSINKASTSYSFDLDGNLSGSNINVESKTTTIFNLSAKLTGESSRDSFVGLWDKIYYQSLE